MTHAFVHLRITDPAALAAYREKAAAALARHGGSVLQAGPVRVLEGTLPAPDAGAVLHFPTPEAARAWIADPDLAEVHALRNKGADSTVFLLG